MLNRKFPTALWISDLSASFNADGVAGTALFDSKKGVSLEIPIGSIPSDGSETLIFNRTRTFERIYGLAQDNSHLTLNSAVGLTLFSSPGTARESWTASMVLASKTDFFESDPLVNSATVKIDGLYEWFNKNPVKYTRSYSTSNTFVSAVIRVDADDLNEIPIYKNEQVEIGLKPAISISDGEKPLRNQSIESDCCLVFRFTSSMPTLGDAIKDYIVPFRDFLSLFMGFRAEILTISFSSAEKKGKFDAFIPFVDAKRDALNKSNYRNMPFTFPTIANKIRGMYDRWLGLPDDGRRAANIMLGIFSYERGLYLDSNMIAAASAFEALSRVGNRTHELDDETFNQRLQAVEDSISDSKTRNWAIRHLKNSNYQMAGTLTSKMLEDLEPLSSYIAPDIPSFKANHRNTRNAYIHQNDFINTDRVLSGEDLYIHTEAVILLIWGKLLSLLGLSPDEIVDALKQTKYKRSSLSNTQAFYSLKDAEGSHGDRQPDHKGL